MSILKQLERSARRAYLRLTQRDFSGTIVTSPHNFITTKQPRILLLRQDRIGDVICTTPLLRILRQELFPASQIDILLSYNNVVLEPLVRNWCTNVWCYEKTYRSFRTLVSVLRRQQYDVVIDLMDNASTTSTMFLKATRIPIRIGIFKENAWVYTHCVPVLDRSQFHYVERIAQLLLPFGVDPKKRDLDLSYPLTPSDISRAASRLEINRYPERIQYVHFHVSARDSSRQWKQEYWLSVAQQLCETHPDLTIGIGADRSSHSIMEKFSGLHRVFCLPPCDSFHEYASLLHFARLVITPDTSIVHVAAALKIPSVVLYHHANPQLMPWYPYRAPYRALLAQHSTSINIIPPEAVVQAADELLCLASPTNAERIFVSP